MGSLPAHNDLVGSASHGHTPPKRRITLVRHLADGMETWVDGQALMFNGPTDRIKQLADRTGAQYVHAKRLRHWLGSGEPTHIGEYTVRRFNNTSADWSGDDGDQRLYLRRWSGCPLALSPSAIGAQAAASPLPGFLLGLGRTGHRPCDLFRLPTRWCLRAGRPLWRPIPCQPPS